MAEIVDMLIEEEEEKYENIAAYFVLISKTLPASGYTFLDLDLRHSKA